MSFIRLTTSLFSALALVFSMQALAAQPDNTPVSENAGSQTTIAATTTVNDKVNINTASVDELKTLKGIGAAKAEAIVNYRTQHGSFKSIDDLSNVKGISDKVLASVLKNNTDRIVLE